MKFIKFLTKGFESAMQHKLNISKKDKNEIREHKTYS